MRVPTAHNWEDDFEPVAASVCRYMTENCGYRQAEPKFETFLNKDIDDNKSEGGTSARSKRSTSSKFKTSISKTGMSKLSSLMKKQGSSNDVKNEFIKNLTGGSFKQPNSGLPMRKTLKSKENDAMTPNA